MYLVSVLILLCSVSTRLIVDKRSQIMGARRQVLSRLSEALG